VDSFTSTNELHERIYAPYAVVVLGVDPQDLLQVPSADNQQPVEALGADRADPSLREGVRVGRLHRCEQHLGAL
jgi:hypothetical protein